MNKLIPGVLVFSCLSFGSFADDLKVYKAGEVKPYESKEIKPANREDDNSNKDQNSPKPLPQAGTSAPASLFRVWHTSVPGGVWTSPSSVPGYDRLNISPGVKSGDLTISSNGYYTWNSYGGKAGRWVPGDKAYPIVLIDSVEKKKWKVGFDPKHTGGRDIVIWDGFVYYDGRK